MLYLFQPGGEKKPPKFCLRLKNVGDVMNCEKIPLTNDENGAYIECFISNSAVKRDALLVIPGGGYHLVCSDREGYPIAEAFMPHKFNCFVLTYSVGKNAKFPRPFDEASLAMKYIKDNAEKFNIYPDRIFCVGFSAGGHLAAMLGTMWHKSTVVPYGENKPKGVILGYPVLTSKKEYCHFGSFQNLLGEQNPSDELLKEFSIENNVDEKTVPAFLFHTMDDQAVSVVGSFYFAEAMKKFGIPLEMHIFPFGPHGAALSNEITSVDGIPPDERVAKWVTLAAEWTKTVK